tara:strand:+ start:446 stop:1204 length:759 start_codon:yes stop_codon:yes gene_type:complete
MEEIDPTIQTIIDIEQNKAKDSEKQLKNTLSKCNSLYEKCMVWRNFIKSQSALLVETEINKDLGILKKKKKENKSGDGSKNGKNFEIKVSLWGKWENNSTGDSSFLQIRPSHNIDYYIFIGFEDLNSVYCIKIPAKELYGIVAKYGGLAHGTKEDEKSASGKKAPLSRMRKDDLILECKARGLAFEGLKKAELYDLLRGADEKKKLTIEDVIKKDDKEYRITITPAKNGTKQTIKAWKDMEKYKTEYDPTNF